MPVTANIPFPVTLVIYEKPVAGQVGFCPEEAENMGYLCRFFELNFGDSKQEEEECSHWLQRSSVD